MKKIAILGISGSIGKQAVEVIRNLKDQYELVGFSVGNNIEYANELLKEFKTVEMVCVKREEDVRKINFDNVKCKETGLVELATYEKVDIVLVSVVGSVGLEATYEAIKCKKDIALANKETLVMAGHIIMNKAQELNVKILPVDSEHSAIFQCLEGQDKEAINKLIITASGGSFRDKTLEELKGVTKKEALSHPNWSMGDKITIDSATMINKGFEVIEAHHLFNIDYDNIDTIIHKESIIHSMVEMKDGAVLAQMGIPSMKLPIQYALTYPKRQGMGNNKMDFKKLKSLNFMEMDLERFEGLALCYKAGRKGHSYPSVLNAANEEAVRLFLEDKIEFLEIIEIIKKQLEEHEVCENPTIDDILRITQEVQKKIKKEYS